MGILDSLIGDSCVLCGSRMRNQNSAQKEMLNTPINDLLKKPFPKKLLNAQICNCKACNSSICVNCYLSHYNLLKKINCPKCSAEMTLDQVFYGAIEINSKYQ
jgi:hypothetical protein